VEARFCFKTIKLFEKPSIVSTLDDTKDISPMAGLGRFSKRDQLKIDQFVGINKEKLSCSFSISQELFSFIVSSWEQEYKLNKTSDNINIFLNISIF